MSNLAQCYNKGCGLKFDPDNNLDDACVYHPGEPYFHDAKKIWTCCKKFSTDFSEFLNIKGCTKSSHNSVKPVVPEPNKKPDNGDTSADTTGFSNLSLGLSALTTNNTTPLVKSLPLKRPPVDEAMIDLPVTTTSSLTTALNALESTRAKQNESDTTELDTVNGATSGTTGQVAIGAACRNKGCQQKYMGIGSDSELCLHHNGFPIFHEGLKFWTCCQRKTTDFESFMQQAGCTTGRHVWTDEAAVKPPYSTALPFTANGGDHQQQNQCRHDWFQLPDSVALSVYAKACLPDSLVAKANATQLQLTFKHHSGGGMSASQRVTAVDAPVVFSRLFTLHGIIVPSESSVKLLGTKVEVTLKKAEPGSWPRLEWVDQRDKEVEEEKTAAVGAN